MTNKPSRNGKHREHIVAEEALRASELRYRRLFESAKDGILILDAQTGRVVDVNPFLIELLGYSRQTFLAKNVWELGFFKDIVANQDKFTELRQKEYIRYDDKALEASDGRRIEVEFVSNVYLVNHHKVIQCNIRDISERKRAAGALRRSEENYRTLLDNLPQRVFLKDCHLAYVSCNSNYAHDLGIDLDAIVGKTDFDFYPTELAEKYRADDQRVMQSGVAAELDEPHLHGGKQYWIHTVKTPVLNDAGECAGIFGIFWDVTERRQREEENQRLITAIEQANDSIVITDVTGAIRYVNPAFERISGYTKKEVLGQNPRIVKSGKQDTAFYRQMWETLTRGEVWHGHFINKKKDGTFFEADATISPVRDAAGEIVNYVAVKRDFTHEAQLEAQLRQSQRMEAIGQLSGGVAHDFNNILAVIMMQAELTAMAKNLPQEVQEGLLQIRAAAERAANLTRQLLLFSRQQVMQARDLDLNEVVAGLAKMLQRIIGEDVCLQFNLHPHSLITRADAGMLDQVLMNLVVNSRDAMPGGGRICIETGEKTFTKEQAALMPDCKPGRHVSLRVTDTGCGIAPENLSRIFEPFFTTKEPGKGTGLGLSTVFGIVKQHGGSLVVESEVGRGTTFEVYLPAIERPGKPADGAAVASEPRGGTETILLVEDEFAVRILTRAVLERAGYRVLEAPSGIEALRIWEQHQDSICLLLTDMVMPEGVSGRELAARVQARNPKLRVIFISGYSADIAGRELSLQQRQYFVQKPASPRQLLETVRRCLDS